MIRSLKLALLLSALTPGIVCAQSLPPEFLAAAREQQKMHTAPADPLCEAQVGRTITPLDVDAVVRQLGTGVPPRGEFETTAQYEARLGSAGQGVPAQLLVTIPVDPKYVLYDADAGQFTVQSWALSSSAAAWSALYDNPAAPWPRPHGGREFVNVTIKSAETVTGTYQARNTYGANLTVSNVRRDSVGIVERLGDEAGGLFFADPSAPSYAPVIIAQLPVAAASASQWRASLRAAVLIEPKSPFVLRGTKRWSPRNDRPTDIAEELTAVIADIRCVLLSDAKNVVLASVATRLCWERHQSCALTSPAQ